MESGDFARCAQAAGRKIRRTSRTHPGTAGRCKVRMGSGIVSLGQHESGQWKAGNATAACRCGMNRREVGSGNVRPHGNAEAAEAAVNSERGEPAKKPGMRIQLSRRDGIQECREEVGRQTPGGIEGRSPVWQGELQRTPMQARRSKAAHADETEAQAGAGEVASLLRDMVRAG